MSLLRLDYANSSHRDLAGDGEEGLDLAGVGYMLERANEIISCADAVLSARAYYGGARRVRSRYLPGTSSPAAKDSSMADCWN
jgi:hypothetical protein